MSNWIKVYDRLPKHMEDVLFYVCSYDHEFVSSPYIGYFDAEELSFYFRLYIPNLDSEWHKIENRVTHWMPLPKMPKR